MCPGATSRSAILWPPLSLNADYLMAIVAVLGTTISPYLFFWQAEEEVEERKDAPDARPLISAPEQAPAASSRRIRIDTYLGMAISNLIALFIVITTAATLHAHGHTDIQTSSQAAEALRPIAGHSTFVVFAARHHRHRDAGGAGAGGLGRLRRGRGAALACRPGAPAGAGQGVLRDDRGGAWASASR